MPPLRVIVHGATGRMGRETLTALGRDADLQPVGGVDREPLGDRFSLPESTDTALYATSLEELVPRCQADVVVDFSTASASMTAAPVAASAGLHLVIGTTGLSDADLATLENLSNEHKVGIIVAPNFALGAVVLGYLARIAARFFDYADIFEAHHEAKIDAPSGTALALARAISSEKSFTHLVPEKEPLAGTRGGEYNGVTIHSTRMPGRLAHHEVVFGALGQTLSLRHDTISRDSFMPAVLLAVKEVVKRRKFEVGLEGILGLTSP